MPDIQCNIKIFENWWEGNRGHTKPVLIKVTARKCSNMSQKLVFGHLSTFNESNFSPSFGNQIVSKGVLTKTKRENISLDHTKLIEEDTSSLIVLFDYIIFKWHRTKLITHKKNIILFNWNHNGITELLSSPKTCHCEKYILCQIYMSPWTKYSFTT